MSQELSLKILGVPFAKQSMRFHSFVLKTPSRTGKPRIITQPYQPKKVVDGEKNFRLQIIEQLPKGFIPWKGGVIVSQVTFKFPELKSMNKTDKGLIAKGFPLFKVTKPDLTDNLMKGLFDAMKGVVFADDSQVCVVKEISKIYSSTPGIDIRMREL
jgi:Holliday junction resolvase RusA-like endonuclease